jgi:hypothetical protein
MRDDTRGKKTRLYVTCLAFGSNARRATTSSSPFSMKCETRPYYAHVPSEEKGDGCLSQISSLTHSLSTLSSFSKHPSTAVSTPASPWTWSSLPSFLEHSPILDPSPRALRHPRPWLGARHCLDRCPGVPRCS